MSSAGCRIATPGGAVAAMPRIEYQPGLLPHVCLPSSRVSPMAKPGLRNRRGAMAGQWITRRSCGCVQNPCVGFVEGCFSGCRCCSGSDRCWPDASIARFSNTNRSLSIWTARASCIFRPARRDSPGGFRAFRSCTRPLEPRNRFSSRCSSGTSRKSRPEHPRRVHPDPFVFLPDRQRCACRTEFAVRRPLLDAGTEPRQQR